MGDLVGRTGPNSESIMVEISSVASSDCPDVNDIAFTQHIVSLSSRYPEKVGWCIDKEVD